MIKVSLKMDVSCEVKELEGLTFHQRFFKDKKHLLKISLFYSCGELRNLNE